MDNQNFDVIIIGSGAGDGTLAYHLAPSGKSILLLERGDWLAREPENWSAEEVFVKNRYVSSASRAQKEETKIPGRFWIFAAFVLLYGICETMSGNWGSLYMMRELGGSTTLASLALTTFWGAVTVGRILFAAIEKWFSERNACEVLPLIAAGAFFAISFLPRSGAHWGILAFALTGLGCSALLPLTLSFAEEELTAIATSVAGGLIAFYQIGYGVAAFGVGPLQSRAGLGLNTIYGGTAIVALMMSALSFVIVRRQATAAAQRG